MKRGIVIVLVCVALVLYAAYAAIHAASGPSGTGGTGRGTTYTVTLSDNGFSPDPLSIRQGDTVTFVSTQGSFFWPASNPHPTHTIYPAFDPREPIAPHSSWSFTFTQAGRWGYHDHLAPYFTGTIIVATSS